MGKTDAPAEATTTELIPLEKVEDVLLHGGALDVVPAEEMQADMVRRILASESLQDAFREFKTTPARELDGVHITVHGIAWAKSAFSEGSGVYALLDVTRDDTDQHEVVSMGGRSLMASFLYAQRNRAMPFSGVLRQERSRTDPERSYWVFKLV